MRRLLQLLVSTVMISGTVGCCMTGVCDCEPNCCPGVKPFAPCGHCGIWGGVPVAPVGAPAANGTAPQKLLPPPADKQDKQDKQDRE
jgi:hypothetical protein